MKKSLLVALALSILAAPVLTAVEASAQSRPAVHEMRQDRHDVRKDRQKVQQHRRPAWMKQGGRYQKGGSRVSDYKRYGLRAPGRNQRWVKVDNDYILVGITTGVIASIIAGR